MLKLETELRRLRVFVFGPASDCDLNEEFCCHLELLTRDNLAAGMSAEQARAEALRRFGDVERIKRGCRAARRGSLPGALLWLIGIVAACGVILWTSPSAPQVNVLGQMLVITVFLFRLLMYLRAWPALIGGSISAAPEFTIARTAPPRTEESEQQQLNRGVSGFATSQMLRIVAVCAVIVCCLCATIVASSAKALSNHLRHVQGQANSDAEKFAGTWVLTVGDVYDLRDSPSTAPFINLPQGLPRNLPLAEVVIELRDGNLTGKRFLYGYGRGENSTAAVVEKGELELVNLHTEANVLVGDVTTPDGKRLPGRWEVKLTGAKEAELRVTGNEVPEEQRKLVVKLHRPQP